MRAAPVPRGKVRLQPRQAAIQPSTVQPTRRLLDRRMGTPSSRHATWLGRYQDWQWDAKRYARTIGVVRFAANLVAATAGRVNLIVEQRNANGDWEETKDTDLKSLLAGYGNETFGQTANELVRLHTWHYQVSGEAVMMHRDDTTGLPEWMIASMDAVEWDKPQKDLATIRFHPGGVVSDGTAVILPRDQMMRYWFPDEEWLGLAVSPMTAVMDDIRRYKSLVRYAQRQAESYLAMNGILWTSERIHGTPASGDATEHEGDDPTSPAEQSDRVFDLYNEWAQMSINDDDSIAAVIPPMLWAGDKDDIPTMIDIGKGLDEHGPEHRTEALQDFARGADSPMALIAGGGSSEENHWGAWITQERFVAAVAPTLDRVTHQDMTVAFLYPNMRLMGRTDLRRTRIGYDATPVIVHPDKSDKALRAALVGAIGYEPLREALGFDESDKPSPEDLELLKQILSNFGSGGGGAAPPGQVPKIKAPGEKVGPSTVDEGPPQPQPTGTGTRITRPAGQPLATAASMLADYLPMVPAGLHPSGEDRSITIGELHIHEGGNGHGNGHTTDMSGKVRTAASLNAGMNGIMIALPVTDDIRSLAAEDGEPPEAMHMTLLYFGDAAEADPTMQGTLKGICSAIASNSEMPYVDLSHMERFAPSPDGHSGPDLFPCVLVDDGPDVPDLVERLKAACDAAGVEFADDHAFRSHVTVGYYPEGEGPEPGPLPTQMAYAPDALMLHWGDEVDTYPFVDAPGPGAQPPQPVLASSHALSQARRAYSEDQPREHGRFSFAEGTDLEVDPLHGAINAPVATMSAFDEAMQAKIMAKVTSRITDDPEAIVGRYRDLLEASKTDGNYEAGLGWYQRTHDDAVALAEREGIPVENVAGMLAAMSPGTDWDTEFPIGTAMAALDKQTIDLQPETLANLQTKIDNLAPGVVVENGMRYADLDARPAVMAMQADYMEGRPSGPGGWGVGYSWDNYARGLEILREDQVDERLNGVKVRSFYDNIVNPADPDTVTIDLKMVQAAAGTREQTNDSSVMSSPSKSSTIRNDDGTVTRLKTEIGPTPYLADAIRVVAQEDGITAHQAQAAIWMEWLYPGGQT